MKVSGKRRLGELLLDSGKISAIQLEKALQATKANGGQLGQVITALGYLSEQQITKTLSKQLGYKIVELNITRPDPELLQKLPQDTAKRLSAVPLKISAKKLEVATSNPLDIPALDELSNIFGLQLKLMIASESDLRKFITRHYRLHSSIAEALLSLGDKPPESRFMVAEQPAKYGDKEQNAPVAKLLFNLVREAIAERASDIHIEPDELSLNIRTRIDGVLYQTGTIPIRLQQPLINRVKVAAGMDISEARLPQDGRFQTEHGDEVVELRVSSFPTIYGENLVIRILHPNMEVATLPQAGLTGSQLKKAETLFKSVSGMVVVTGPTGSGKTSTLYAALNLINRPERNIITIEDPVEYRLAGIRQSQVNRKAGLGFAGSLRSMLRQDPDVIMVGEIRDEETAQIAIESAMTGHLLLTSMHTNDSTSTVDRLRELGVEPYLIAANLKGVIAQRLVRRICKECCGKPDSLDGCQYCKDSGYRGRTGIFEILMIDEPLKELINHGAGQVELRRYMTEVQKQNSLQQDGIQKAKDGITSEQEVQRVTSGR